MTMLSHFDKSRKPLILDAIATSRTVRYFLSIDLSIRPIGDRGTNEMLGSQSNILDNTKLEEQDLAIEQWLKLVVLQALKNLQVTRKNYARSLVKGSSPSIHLY